MSQLSFRQRLQTGAPILADGAMGTMLHAYSDARADACFDAMNLESPDIVRGIHQAYLEAGAELIATNTFGANEFKLAGAGKADQLAQINRIGVQLAREACAQSGGVGYVAGSVGPLGVGIAPFGAVSQTAAREAYALQLKALLEAGVDLIQFETFREHKELLLAVSVLRELSSRLPVLAQATFFHENLSYAGYPPARVANDLGRAGVDIIGVNCGSGPAGIAEALRQMRFALPDAVFSAMPNAGFPEVVGGRILYPASADYLADFAASAVELGALVVGGCCGTKPEHIAAMRTALDAAPSRAAIDLHVAESMSEQESQAPDAPTELAERLADGLFTTTVEMAPPRSYRTEPLLQAARRLRAAGADLINVADTPAARMKMSAWAVAHLLQTQIGMETVLHFPTRGRNMLRVQGDLLASHALGLRNLFVVMGDPTRIGDFPDASDLNDVAPSRLIQVIKQGMNRGVDMAGNSIGKPSSFTVGCALNMGADDIDREIRILRKKQAAGADFALGQAVFEPDRIRRFHQRYAELCGEAFVLPVLMALMPLRSLRQARYLHNEVPGISIPADIMARLAAAGDEAPRAGVQIAQELLDEMASLVQGAYIIPAGDYDLAAEVIATIRERGSSP